MDNLPKNTPTDIATNVYRNLGSRFGVNQTPTHSHNDIDSPRLSPSSINTSATLSAQSGSVLSGETVSNLQPPIVVFPLPILSAAPTGTAPDGTVVLVKSIPVTGMYARITGAWVFIGP